MESIESRCDAYKTTRLPTYEARKEHNVGIDVFKGILMLLVILGHNPYFSSHYKDAFFSLYKFHVASFMLIPFLIPARPTNLADVKDRAVRYLVPHYIFFVSGSLLYLYFVIWERNMDIYMWAHNFVLAATLGAQCYFKESVGFHMFWFLPAFYLLTVIRGIYVSHWAFLRRFILIVAVLAHLFIGIFSWDVTSCLPFSISLVLFIFPLGLLIERFRLTLKRPSIQLATSIVFAACVWFGQEYHLDNALSGGGRFYPVYDLRKFVLQDTYVLTGFCFIYFISTLLKLPLFIIIGRYSMPMFLCHSFIQQILIRAGILDLIEGYVGIQMLTLALFFFCVVFFSLGFSILVCQDPRLNQLLFPKNWESWRSAWCH